MSRGQLQLIFQHIHSAIPYLLRRSPSPLSTYRALDYKLINGVYAPFVRVKRLVFSNTSYHANRGHNDFENGSPDNREAPEIKDEKIRSSSILYWLVLSGSRPSKYHVADDVTEAVFLTCWHMIFSAIATQILARTTRLLDGRKNVHMTSDKYLRAVVPIGLVYSGSLICSNLTYLYLSVSFAGAPVAVLVTGWIWGVAKPSWTVFLKVIVIVFGVVLASLGEIRFDWLGFTFQVGGIVFEAIRLIMIQVLLSEDGQSMDPLVSLYYYAPVCAAMNLVMVWYTELASFKMEDFSRVGPTTLLFNAVVAFMLNVSSVFLIGKTSGLVITLTGIFKSILLVVTSVLAWGTYIGNLQLFGYAVALLGLFFYSVPWETIQACASALKDGILSTL
ncbi:hypothetical protein VP1G_00193 [Cytospora mali]|uniref:Sugar phosphate transporter domain-containing protein n=1 Tax=Cytospora mali TaxID=578113 RepID=A0A194ULZ4_CYTMA|nr:hypothetical protein VP1G_00193 [Valsa mali var. pyri (nom. inval.)]